VSDQGDLLRPEGIPGSSLTGPHPVGRYATALRDKLRTFTNVQVFGEVFGFKPGRAKVYFELRDADGALPCSMWRREWDALGLGTLSDGAQVVAAGGCDFYPGSRSASPGFSFAVTDVRLAGEGDLLAQLERLRKALHAEGLFEPQKRLTIPALPRTIGVVTGEHGKARDDVIAGLHRRGWAGRVVWAFAPVQDRHAAPRITQALQDLAACEEIDVIVVARGGGSLADMFAFCDENLCRTVALLRVPVIASVGHHTDRTLIDDVAAVSCSTPTHAAEAAVPVDCAAARGQLQSAAARLGREARRVAVARVEVHGRAVRLDRLGRRALVDRARHLSALSRAPAEHVGRHRVKLHQQLRELRASARRGLAEGASITRVRATVLERKAAATTVVTARETGVLAARAGGLERAASLQRRRTDIERLALALAAHDPQRTLERGYALIEDPAGEPVTSAETARTLDAMTVRLHDGTVPVRRDDR
jgi:exodeoxyribonuclease VII large subunit